MGDLAFREVLFELVPLLRGDVAVLVRGAQRAAVVDKGAVGPDDVVGEHRRVGLSGGQGGMPHELLDDMRRQPAARASVAKIRRKSCAV
jgi:hypothetical protein